MEQDHSTFETELDLWFYYSNESKIEYWWGVHEHAKAQNDRRSVNGSRDEATRLAEEQGALAITDMMIVDAHVQLKDQSAKTCKIARRAYWHARTAFRGWRALRTLV